MMLLAEGVWRQRSKPYQTIEFQPPHNRHVPYTVTILLYGPRRKLLSALLRREHMPEFPGRTVKIAIHQPTNCRACRWQVLWHSPAEV